jgi:hypothetical protein
MVHEEEGAVFLRDLAAGEHIRAEAPREGKVELFAETRGLFKVNAKKLFFLNSLGAWRPSPAGRNWPSWTRGGFIRAELIAGGIGDLPLGC